MKNICFFGLYLFTVLLVSCEKTEEVVGSDHVTENTELKNTGVSEDLYPDEDSAIKLSGTRAEQMLDILNKVNPEDAKVLYDTKISESEFEEIKAFTDELVAGLSTSMEKHERIFYWICENIEYRQGDNDPYPVFKNRYGICQGYSNLLKVMLLSQDIPVISVNGMMYNMGHAWAYVYTDDCWLMSDPTNGIFLFATDVSQYVGYEPASAEIALFEDENFCFEYNDGHLNLSKIKNGEFAITVPYSAGGFVVTSFNPESDIPENIREIYIGTNISTLGNQGLVGLGLYAKSVESIFIDSQNPDLESYKGIVYHKHGDTTTPYYIPYGKTRIELKPNKIYSKGVIVRHNCVEEIIFPKGVELIGDYAVEACPNLKRVYIPENAVITDNALYGMSQEIEIIIEKEGTGIPVVTVD